MSALPTELFLPTALAREIYREIADLPVVDIHTHADLPMILRNETPPDPWTALCAGDHYTSSIMESLGAISREKFYCADTPPFEKWRALAEVFPLLSGNHLRDWMRMTFTLLGVERSLAPATAREIWDELGAILSTDENRPIEVIRRTGSETIATTNHPTDTLEEHQQAQTIFGEGCWIPTWRPDFLFNMRPSPMGGKTWLDQVRSLEAATGAAITGDWKAFLEALSDRHDFFARMGCRGSDYGMQRLAGHDAPELRARAIFESASKGNPIDATEADDFLAWMLRFSMELDAAKGWYSQIHFGAARNQRRMAERLGGLDSGCDTIGPAEPVAAGLHDLLNHFDRADNPRSFLLLLYSMTRANWDQAAALSRIQPGVYLGMAWWYFDSVSGMLDFFRTMPDVSAGFAKIGPFVTDARNIYSLRPRTEMYRRCLATVLAELVETRREPMDDIIALARYLCSEHPKGFLK